MNEILFRGKRVDTGAWVYGNLIQMDNESSQCFIFPYYDLASSMSCQQLVALKMVPVIPETVGQYTGLKDKNGTKIFEGDILRGFEYPYCSDGEDNYYGQVVWFINSPAFGICTYKVPNAKVRGISQGNSDYMEDWEPTSWEVIGNIHDNPELLEVEG